MLNNLFLKGEEMSQLKKTMLVSVSVYLSVLIATTFGRANPHTLLRLKRI